MKYLFLVPFAVALTLEAFQQELIKGGLSTQSFSVVHSLVYLVAGILVYFSAKQGSYSKNTKLFLYAIAAIGVLFSVIKIVRVF